jgi:hypothetical protein
LAASLALCAAARLHAQASPPPAPPGAPTAPATRPVTGFVPSYEIMKTVLAAGFHPLAPPLREGTTYVLRATDFRGILMRVVVDARTGAIRDVNRIVPGPGSYGQIGPEPPPYGMAPPYNPTDYDGPMAPPRELAPPRPASPPLPRPRPPALLTAKPAATPAAAPQINTEVMTAVPPAAAAAPKKTNPAAVPLND